ncbi:MAG: hypothetical protein M3Q30_17845 [Actinomycetota bacterium]|nr:hypothetical protein [Actinomycetota bacterium]
MRKTGKLWIRLKGKLTRPVADAAGDRPSEANAELEAKTGSKPEEDAVEAAEQEVRRRHGDIGRPRRR